MSKKDKEKNAQEQSPVTWADLHKTLAKINEALERIAMCLERIEVELGRVEWPKK